MWSDYMVFMRIARDFMDYLFLDSGLQIPNNNWSLNNE